MSDPVVSRRPEVARVPERSHVLAAIYRDLCAIGRAAIAAKTKAAADWETASGPQEAHDESARPSS
jgi:hypothetical protein